VWERQTREGACHELPANSHSLCFAAIKRWQNFLRGFLSHQACGHNLISASFNSFSSGKSKSTGHRSCMWMGTLHIRAKRQEQNHGRRARKRMGWWNTNLEENGTKWERNINDVSCDVTEPRFPDRYWRVTPFNPSKPEVHLNDS
jgi:hypothetical protein